MNKKIQRTYTEIEQAKARIAELQGLLPRLEKQKTELENTEIVRLVRSANIAPEDLEVFLQTIPKKIITPVAPVTLSAPPNRVFKDRRDDADV